MTVFFTSDTHYGHHNVIRHAKRPFADVQEMEKVFIDNWNRVVTPKDTVYHLGDFSFGPKTAIMATLVQLNGTKHFIFGNHDTRLVQLARGKDPEEHGMHSLFSRLVASAEHYKEISVEGQSIVLMHYGMRVWNKGHHGAWHLYGHSHANLPPHGRSVDVGVDSHWVTGEATYTPFSFEQVAAFMATRDFVPVDHHGAKEES